MDEFYYKTVIFSTHQELKARLKALPSVLRTITFGGYIGDRYAIVLAERLRDNKNITALHLEGTGIGIEGAMVLAAFLRGNNCTLQKITGLPDCPATKELNEMCAENRRQYLARHNYSPFKLQ